MTTETHQRRCHDCGHVGNYTSSVRPDCLCKECGSQDTRRVKAAATDPLRCPACDVSLVHHPGLFPTCEKLAAANERLALWEWLCEQGFSVQRVSLVGDRQWSVLDDDDGDPVAYGESPEAAIRNAMNED